MNNKDKAPWGYDEDYNHYTRSRFMRLGKARKIAAMVSWFRSNYEGPEHRTPRDSGDWVWIWGGPFDASDMIQDNFGDDVEYELMEEAISFVEQDGIEWTRTEGHGDYDDRIEIEPTREQTQKDLEARVAALEKLLSSPPPIVDHGGMGHNMPPNENGLEDIAASKDEMNNVLGEIRNEIRALSNEIQKTSPAEESLRERQSNLYRISETILKWLGKKADIIIDETLKSLAKYGPPVGIAAYFLDLKFQITGIANKILEFIHTLPSAGF